MDRGDSRQTYNPHLKDKEDLEFYTPTPQRERMSAKSVGVSNPKNKSDSLITNCDKISELTGESPP